ncbi:hypothetical protein FRC07_009139, partial [Ceratobasidium sp. 392]
MPTSRAAAIRIEDAAGIIVSGGPVSLKLLQGILSATGTPDNAHSFFDQKLASAFVRLVDERSRNHPAVNDRKAIILMAMDLICRFSAGGFACGDEQALTELMAEECYEGPELTAGPTDQQDEELVVITTTNMLLSGSLSLKLSLHLHRWAGYFLHAGRPDLMLLFAKASLGRLWKALDPMKEFQLAFLGFRDIMRLTEGVIRHILYVNNTYVVA